MDQPVFVDWLNRNEKPLSMVMDASRRPEYYNPLVPRRTEEYTGALIESLLPNVQMCRELGAALACRAMLRVSERKFDQAWHDLLTCHRLGRLVGRGGTLVQLLFGIAIDQIASKADIMFLNQAEIPSKQVRAHLQELQKLLPMPAVADMIDLTERFMLLDSMMLVAISSTNLEGLSGSFNASRKNSSFRERMFTNSIDWDPAFRNAKRWYDRCVAGARMTDRTARAAEIAQIEKELNSLKRESDQLGFIERSFIAPTRRGEMIGNILIGLFLPAFDKVQGAAERYEQWQRILHLAFALAAHQRDHGNYPATLGELAPNYLDKVPHDLFSGKPLIYRPAENGYLLYSVGPNGKDDEGQTTDDEPRGDDIAVRIPVPEPKAKK